MLINRFKELLRGYANGDVPEGRILEYVQNLAFESLEFAKIDHHRNLRKGFPEVIFCQGKTSEQIAAIAERIVERGDNMLASRATQENYEAVKALIPKAEYNALARCITVEVRKLKPKTKKTILILSAGTADLPISEEAYVTARIMGNNVARIVDVGVAGIHRLLNYRQELETAGVIIVVAGMEGALPSVVGGLVSKPVIAVPTSVGYGTSFGGVTALLGMLNSCASGITVVNIDNGFGAAYAATLMLQNI